MNFAQNNHPTRLFGPIRLFGPTRLFGTWEYFLIFVHESKCGVSTNNLPTYYCRRSLWTPPLVDNQKPWLLSTSKKKNMQKVLFLHR